MIETIKATLVYPVVDRYVTMAIKGRKIGMGFWFGYGGKMELFDKTPEDCLNREVKKEGGFLIPTTALERIGMMDFYNGPEDKIPFGNPSVRVLCYRALAIEGIPRSSPEMLGPTKFPIDQLPENEMKPGDLPLVLKIIHGEKYFKGWARFQDKKGTILIAGPVFDSCSLKDLVF